MRIIALDIALHTGYAIGDGTVENTVFGTVSFHKFKKDSAVLGRRFSEWLGEKIEECAPGIIVVEKPFFRGAASWALSGLVWEAHREAEFNDISRAEYAPTMIKKHVTGDGRAGKDEIITTIRNLGFSVKNDHEADAVGLLLLHKASAA